MRAHQDPDGDVDEPGLGDGAAQVLGLGRARQRNLPGWVEKRRKKQETEGE